MDIRATLEALKNYAYSDQPIDNMVVAVNAAKSEMQKRIFNSESGSKDVSGNGLGGYSNAYARFRQQKGRQSSVVDLEFTGSLRRSIKTEIANGVVSIVVDNPVESKKIGYIEKNYKRNIFDLSAKEQEELENTFNELIFQDIKEILNAAS